MFKYVDSGLACSNSDWRPEQYVYMAVAGMGVMVALAFAVTRLPEVSEAGLQATAAALAEHANADPKSNEPFYKQYRAIFGFVAQFVRFFFCESDGHTLTSYRGQMYVGAQVTIGMFFFLILRKLYIENHRFIFSGSFFLNYVTESAGRTTADASNLLSYSLIIFTG